MCFLAEQKVYLKNGKWFNHPINSISKPQILSNIYLRNCDLKRLLQIGIRNVYNFGHKINLVLYNFTFYLFIANPTLIVKETLILTDSLSEVYGLTKMHKKGIYKYIFLLQKVIMILRSIFQQFVKDTFMSIIALY